MKLSNRIVSIACLVVCAGCAAGAPRGKDPWTMKTPAMEALGPSLDPALTAPASANVIAIDQQGFPIDPDDPRQFDNRLCDEAYAKQLDTMMKDADRWTAAHPKDGVQQILIFVHGGLNEPLENLNSPNGLVNHRRLLMSEGYYPIFVVWHSGLKSSYAEHLTKVRQGRYEEDQGWASPFFFLADAGRAISRIPVVGARMLSHDFSRLGGEWKAADTHEAAAVFSGNPQLRSAFWATHELLAEYDRSPATAIQVSMGGIDLNPVSKGEVVLLGVEALGRGLLTWALDSVGTAAWDNMYRRSLMLFDGPNANLLGHATDEQAALLARAGKPGPLQQLIDQLAKHSPHRNRPATMPSTITTSVDPTTMPAKWKITVIGHSMGAIVLNEFVSHSSRLDIANIVYMAAACTVREAHAAVLPYLQTHPDAEFYNLCLHPVNDLREDQGYFVGPRGGLLVWIDDMFANPATTFDRTMGRWDNVVQTAYSIPESVRPRVHLKAFPLYADRALAKCRDLPQQHGDFAGCNYGKPSFWMTLDHSSAMETIRPLASQMRVLEATR